MNSPTPICFTPVTWATLFSCCLVVLPFASSPVLQAAPDDAQQILHAAGIRGGFIVHLGCGDGELTHALRASEAYQVQGLETDPARVATARARLREKGQYGPVTIEQYGGATLPYIDNLVNLLVVQNPEQVRSTELMRVLTPEGVALTLENGRWVKTVKPRDESLDEWTHYFYDARGNAVSQDRVVAPPNRLQWVGSPKWSRHHDRMASMSAMVTAGGRMFYIMDQGSRVSILLPSKWQLVARDAFNGVVLWQRLIPNWHSQLWPLKSGPTQLARRLVSDGEHVYVTLGLHEPVVQLDAATGETLQTYEASRGAEEILHRDGTLFVLRNPEAWALKDYAPKFNTGDQKRVETEFNWDGKPRELVVLNAADGKTLWKVAGKIAPLTLGTDGRSVVFFDDEKIQCLDASTGDLRWASDPVERRKLFEYNYAPRLVVYKDVILYAGGDGQMKSFQASTGKELWTSPHDRSGYRSPEDLLVAGGLVWSAPTTSGRMSGEFTGRDPFTGEIKKQFPPDVETYWFHHRCYIAKATEKYLIPSRTGIEFVDHESEHWDINHWVRGGCLYGVLPANGLTYAPPHNCACYPEAKLYGMNALSAGSRHPEPIPDAQRLFKGPAYDSPLQGKEAAQEEWPTFRHDNQRSGYTSQQLNRDRSIAWEVELGGSLTASVVADGKVFIAQKENHTLYALHAETGRIAWRFTPGGPVDSPPTWWQGRVYFGSADGRVYCLRASDGELIWRYQAAPSDRRLMAFEQLESVWPVHGNILIEKGQASFVAGRSAFLDGGMRYIKLDAESGEKRVETVIDDIDPESGQDLQVRLRTLQMPVGLNDILSSDGEYLYLRSQKIDPQGQRVDIGPISGNAAEQGGAQRGAGAHIFAPMGFLDDTWFHRSYWVYGKNFAGGHNGYFQAGKYAPAGRILVFDGEKVYGYGRRPEFLKWTTTLEHQLFSAPREAPEVPVSAAGVEAAGPGVRFQNADRIDPTGKPLTVQAWVLPDGKSGVILAHGGPVNGYALWLDQGIPVFSVTSGSSTANARAAQALGDGWQHLAGVLKSEGTVELYVSGRLAKTTQGALIKAQPKQTLELGVDGGSAVGPYPAGNFYTGMMDHVAIFHSALAAETILDHYLDPDQVAGAKPVLFCTMDHGDARDDSGGSLHGVVRGADAGKGRQRGALWFRQAPRPTARANNQTGPRSQTAVQHDWTSYVPVITRAMAMAGKTVFIAGAPDLIDEEYAFERLTEKDETILAELREQDAALEGKKGAELLVINSSSGHQENSLPLVSPPVWDGISVAYGSLFVGSMDGKVRRFGKHE